LAIIAAPAAAQEVERVVVTGTLIQGNTNVVSPVTVIDTTTLDQRGISSIQNALQQTLANNGPAITNSWTTQGNFAQGASGISLRGLTSNSTLVLFDGMRSAYYPLADDGTRNFVDLNTIPDDIVENIQILRDGASSAYGADAIAGVVNIITKKEFQGLSARAEGGISDRGDATQWKMSVTAGVGDLSKDKVNFYMSASYFHSDKLMMASRPYPFNSSDFRNVCYQGTCGGFAYQPVLNAGSNADGSLALNTAGNLMVRPANLTYDPLDGHVIVTGVAGSKYQFLNPGCGRGTPYTLTAADKAGLGATDPNTVCQYDLNKLYGAITPMLTRFAVTGHSAFELPNGIEGSVEANFMQDTVSYPATPGAMVANAPAPIYYNRFSTNAVKGPANATGSEQLFLPVWVCAARVNCDTAQDKKLNANNPFAIDPINNANNHAARILGNFTDIPTFNETRDRTYRLAATLQGSLLDDWRWEVGATASHIDLHRLSRNYIYIQHLLDLVNDGNYNFRDPSQNNTPLDALGKMTANQYLMPDNVADSSSDEAQIKASVTAPLYKLPGGDLTVVVGASISYEGINAPSGNSDANGPTQRWFNLNAFGTVGSRDVYATYFEVNAPILDELIVNVSGRYDYYCGSGVDCTKPGGSFSNFSPKIGIWSKPLDWVTLKGTYSQGFRVPSFAEANAFPTTGYVANSASYFNDTYLAQYNCTVATYSTCPSYIRSSYGQTTLASPNLKPEKSRSWTMDLTLQPLDEVTITTTYYNIKKTAAITTPSNAPALVAYYAGQPIPAGYVVIPDAPSLATPNAKPRVAFVQAHFINANAIRTSGFDFSVTYDSDLKFVEDVLGPVHLTSSAQATFIQNLDTKFPDGTIERYDGTLGNNNLTAGTGTPKWRGTWQNTVTAGIYDVTGTLNWTSGYNLSAMDQGNAYRDCGLDDGSRPCRTADYLTFDLNAQAHVRPDTTVYFTMLNVFDTLPPVDTIATYGSTGYNVVVGGDGILGRYLKMGVKFDY
jgi:iron complex outermembrane receptor protein